MNLRSANGSQSANRSLRDLAALGQLRGTLSIDEIRESLPINQMSEEEVGRAIAYLEDKGIEVVVDPGLLTGSARPGAAARFDRSAGGPVNTTAPRTDLSPQPSRSLPEQPVPVRSREHSRSVTVVVLSAGVVVCALAAILVWMLR
ncbi:MULTISPECIES: RNA polymerase sigma factor region1.1 domain-containing protein [unclassified Bradyrhizobium]|uniref:RNA polymerase sigma factor region1.1 domain-containing protein n=1 Tax=Bradyrhizobium sp. LLZ17 TaxID=3239388 RepID=A0AB39XR40_9BRAD